MPSGDAWRAELELVLDQRAHFLITPEEAVRRFRTLGLSEADLERYLRTARTKLRAP